MAPTAREKAFDQLVKNIAYIASAAFKRDTLDGTTAEERTAQTNLGKRFAGIFMNHQVEWFGFDGKTQKTGRKTTTLGSFLGWIDSGLNNVMAGINKLNAKADAILEAIKLVNSQPTGAIDPKVLEEAIGKAMEKASKDFGSIEGTYEMKKVEGK